MQLGKGKEIGDKEKEFDSPDGIVIEGTASMGAIDVTQLPRNFEETHDPKKMATLMHLSNFLAQRNQTNKVADKKEKIALKEIKKRLSVFNMACLKKREQEYIDLSRKMLANLNKILKKETPKKVVDEKRGILDKLFSKKKK